MATRIIDRLYTVLGYQYDPKGLANFERSLARGRQRLTDFSRSTAKVGTVLTGLAIGTVRSFGNYEAEMAKIEGLVGISREQLQAWRGDIEDIARETAQSPKALAEALFFITSAGLRGSDAIDILRESARAAAAGLGNQATIVDLLTSAMNAYGPEVLNAAQATDTLVEAVRLGKLDPASLADAMGRALPVASAMGVRFNEVAGLMAAMSKTGTTAAEAVTQLNAVMIGLLKPQQNAQKALKSVGLDFQELRDMAGDPNVGLFGVLTKVRDAFEGNNQALIKVFPNIRAVRGVFDLLGPQLESNAALLDEMADSTGITDEAFAAAERTINFKFRKSLAGLQIQVMRVGESLVPLAERILAFVNRAIDWFDGLSDGWKRVVTATLAAGPPLLAVAAAARLTAISFGVLAAPIKAVIFLKGLMTAAAVGTRIALLAQATATGVATAAQWLFNVALTANPIGIVIVAIGALIALIVALATNVGGVRDKLGQLWGWITGAFGRLGAWLSGLDWSDIGLKIIKTLIAGMVPGGPLMFAAVKGIFGKVRKLLPFSDAMEGPFSDLTRSGRALAETMAAGMDKSAHVLYDSVASAFAIPLTLPVGPASVGGGSGGDIIVQVTLGDMTVNGANGDPEDIRNAVSEAVGEQMRGLAENVDTRRRA